MFKPFFRRIAIHCLAVWLITIVIAFPTPVFSSGELFGLQKGGVKSVTPIDAEMVDGVIITHKRKLVLYVEFEGGNPSFIQICDNEMFELCEWQRMRFDGRITFTLSEGAGMKKIYLRAKYLSRPGKIKVLNVKYVPE